VPTHLIKVRVKGVVPALQSSGSDFTKSWQGSAFGRFGLVMVGLAFLIAVIVMLQGALTKKFHRELRLKVRVTVLLSKAFTQQPHLARPH
jgi:hypothetical protein